MPPALRVEPARDEPELELIRFPAFAARTKRFDQPQRWLVLGGPGSGKTTLLRHLALVMAQEEQLSVWLNAGILDRLAPAQEPAELLRACQPPEIDDTLWRGRARRGRILILLDDVSEMEFRFAGNERWRMVLRLLKGPHRFPVVATARFLPEEFLADEADDEVELAQLAPFSPVETRAYLAQRGLSAETSRSRIEAAGLGGVADNPLLLRLIADHLLDPEAGALPRSQGCSVLAGEQGADRRLGC